MFHFCASYQSIYLALYGLGLQPRRRWLIARPVCYTVTLWIWPSLVAQGEEWGSQPKQNVTHVQTLFSCRGEMPTMHLPRAHWHNVSVYSLLTDNESGVWVSIEGTHILWHTTWSKPNRLANRRRLYRSLSTANNGSNKDLPTGGGYIEGSQQLMMVLIETPEEEHCHWARARAGCQVAIQIMTQQDPALETRETLELWMSIDEAVGDETVPQVRG